MHNRTPSMAKALALKRVFHVSDMLPPARLWCLHWQASGDAERIALFGALVVSMHFRNVHIIVQVSRHGAKRMGVFEERRRQLRRLSQWQTAVRLNSRGTAEA